MQVFKEIKGDHHWDDVRLSAQTMLIARQCTAAFVEALHNKGVRLDAENTMDYITADPIKVNTGAETRMLLMEPLQVGDMQKFTTNRHDMGGFAEENTPKAYFAHALACFSHTTFTAGAALLTDVQGIGNRLFDPAWISQRQPSRLNPAFGMGNVGPATIRAFFRRHDHENNPLCRALGTAAPASHSWMFLDLKIGLAVSNRTDRKWLMDNITAYGGYGVHITRQTHDKV